MRHVVEKKAPFIFCFLSKYIFHRNVSLHHIIKSHENVTRVFNNKLCWQGPFGTQKLGTKTQQKEEGLFFIENNTKPHTVTRLSNRRAQTSLTEADHFPHVNPRSLKARSWKLLVLKQICAELCLVRYGSH